MPRRSSCRSVEHIVKGNKNNSETVREDQQSGTEIDPALEECNENSSVNDNEDYESRSQGVTDLDQSGPKRIRSYTFRPYWYDKFKWLRVINEEQRLVICKVCCDGFANSAWAHGKQLPTWRVYPFQYHEERDKAHLRAVAEQKTRPKSVFASLAEVIYAHEMKNGTSSLMKHKCLSEASEENKNGAIGDSSGKLGLFHDDDVSDSGKIVESFDPDNYDNGEDEDDEQAEMACLNDLRSKVTANDRLHSLDDSMPVFKGSLKRKASKNQPHKIKLAKTDDDDGQSGLDTDYAVEQQQVRRCKDSSVACLIDNAAINLPNRVQKANSTPLSALERAEVRSRISRNEAETRYWRTMTAKVEEEVKKLLLEQIKLQRELGLLPDETRDTAE